MYQKALPQIVKVGEEVAAKLNFPKVFFTDVEAGVMIMENLKTQGFYMKKKGICKQMNFKCSNKGLNWLSIV